MIFGRILCLVALCCTPLPCEAKGGKKETGMVRCNRFGCHSIMDNIDPIRVECANKLGVSFNTQTRHFEGPPPLMDKWRACSGMPPMFGPGPAKVPCANKVGAKFDYKIRHFTGPPKMMRAFDECVANGRRS